MSPDRVQEPAPVTVTTHRARDPALREEWDRLQACAPGASLFTTSDWLDAWFGAFGLHKEPRIVTVRRGGLLIGIAPLIWSRLWRRPWLSMHHAQPEDLTFLKGSRRAGCLVPIRQLGVAANLQSGNIRGGVVALPGQEAAALQGVFGHLAADAGWDVMCLPGVAADAVAGLRDAGERAGLRVATIADVHRLYGQPVRPWAEYLAGRSKHFRSRQRAYEAKLRALGALSSAIVTEGPRLLETLDEMFILARQSWKEHGDRDPAVHLPLTPEAMRFYRTLVAARARAGRAVLVGARLDATLVAALLAVREHDVLYFLQIFHAPAVAAGSPGRFLFARIMQWAAAHGIARIDANGNTDLVRRFYDEAQAYTQMFVFRPRGYSGWLYRLAAGLERLRMRRGWRSAAMSRDPADPARLAVPLAAPWHGSGLRRPLD